MKIFVQCQLAVVLMLCHADSVHSGPLFQWIADWGPEAIPYPSRPAFGVFAPGSQGIHDEDFRFGASAAAKGKITDTDKMPGVLRTYAVATQQNVLFGSQSSAQAWVQFSRPFELFERAVVTVSSGVEGKLKIEDTEGSASVSYNAGLATMGGQIIQYVYPVPQASTSLVGNINGISELLVNKSGSVKVVLDPGQYKVWGGLGSVAIMFADTFGGDRAISDFLASHKVSMSVAPVPEPSNLEQAAAAIFVLAVVSWMRRRKKSPATLSSSVL